MSSPDGSRDAVAFIRDCGATTDRDTLKISYSTASPVLQERQVDGIAIVYGKR